MLSYSSALSCDISYTMKLLRQKNRPEQLIVNRDYWEIIDVQTIIMMSISYILSKEIPSETRLCKLIWCQIQCLNCHKPEYSMLKDE